MEKLVKAAIETATALKKTPDSVAWTDDVPWPQPYHLWSPEKNEWQPATASSSSSSSNRTRQTSISNIAVYSWNIDFMLPFPTPRMDAALKHLCSQVQENNELQPNSTTAVIINLQECVPSDLIAISQKQWIRENFYITDLDSSDWASGMYGTATLVDRRLEVSACFRVHFSKTRMERDALFVDVSAVTESGTQGPIVRVANSHLESLALDPPLRPAQMQLIASQMHAQETTRVAGAVVTGDFNAIQPFDLTLHSDNGLKDAYLELGGAENSDDGYTWGQQALPELRKLYGCSRMDKAFYCGEGIKLLKFERIGADVEIAEEEQEQREHLVGLGFEKPWVTDHLGIKAVFELAND